MTPERWLPVVGFEGFYEVSGFGRVRSLDRTVITSNSARRYRGKMLSSYVNVGTRGYPFVRLSSPQLRGNYAVHVLVLTAHVGPCPPGQETRHGPAGKLHAAVTNLSWGTRSKNVGMDRLRDGQDNRGERHGNHKLTTEQVLEMRRRRAEGEELLSLAAAYSTSFQNVSDICLGKRWAWL